jgi:hypothetical protein
LIGTRPPSGRGFDSDFVDPGRPPRDGGGGSGWVLLLRAPNDIDAHLLTGRLEEAGVETTTIKDRGRPGAWLLGASDAWAPVAILVRKLQLDEARIVLAELSMEGPPAVVTPSGPRSRWRGPVLWWVTAIGLGLLFTGLGLVQAANDLERCGSGACETAER